MSAWIGISLGDVTGVGPEVTLKALLRPQEGDDSRYLIIGDAAWLHRANLSVQLPVAPFTGYEVPGRVFVLSPDPEPLPLDLRPGSPAAAEATLRWLEEGAHRCLQQELSALVTAPVNKESIIRTGHPFVGQTEFLSQLAGTDRTAMMLLGHDDRGRWLRVVLATTHVPIRLVADQLTIHKIVLAIELAAEACSKLGLPQARVGVCGLNPHAGEGGELGTEDRDVITPAVADARRKGYNAVGPLSADTLFHHAFRGDFDVVVAMYHDQGLVPLKMVAFDNGVNWTLGLPFIRTSPDHGTAYDLAGKNLADPSSMLAALRLAASLAKKVPSSAM